MFCDSSFASLSCDDVDLKIGEQTGSDIWTQCINFQIDTLEKRIWKQIEEDYQMDSIKLEHYSETANVYFHHLRLNLLRRRYGETVERALAQWQRIELTVKALQALVDEKVSVSY